VGSLDGGPVVFWPTGQPAGCSPARQIRMTNEATGAGDAAMAHLDQAVMGDVPRLSGADLLAAAGVPAEVAARLWRSLGVPAARAADGPAFYEADLAALRGALEYLGPDPTSDLGLQQVRVLAGAMARVAEAAVDAWEAGNSGLADPSGLADRRAALEGLAVYVLRRQLYAALRRRLSQRDEAHGAPVIVGFVDLVRFTALTESVAEEELARVVARFEEVAYETVVSGGGRIVKTIGDAVMFVADAPEAAVGSALALVEAYNQDPLVPPARAGLAAGPVLAWEGDYFGRPVNLAARIVEAARARTVVTDAALHDALVGSTELEWSPLPPKRLKGCGRPQLWAVRARSAPVA